MKEAISQSHVTILQPAFPGHSSRCQHVSRLTWHALLLVARQRVTDGLASAAEAVLNRTQGALALVLGAVTAGAGGISEFLRCRLVALGLDGSSNLIANTRGTLRRLLHRGLLGVWSDLLRCLLAETLAKVVRHVGCWLLVG